VLPLGGRLRAAESEMREIIMAIVRFEGWGGLTIEGIRDGIPGRDGLRD